jgi:predicted molibdopterin-dependent oxidoreductase YjgC
MTQVSLTIDGLQVQVPEGITILEAAQRNDIRIPTLCHDPALEPYGGCRMCIVEVEGLRGMPTACTTVVAEGMKVITENEQILTARRMVMRLMMADHPSDCLNCRANLDCELQKMSVELGVREHGLLATGRKGTQDVSNAVFTRDMDKCILCARCTRVCQEVLGLGAISMMRRGTRSEPGPFLGGEIRASTCESCGECVVQCPTGALAFCEVTAEPDREVATVCPYCGTGCGILLGVRKGKLVRARGEPDNPVNHGLLCVKGRFGSFQYVQHKDRLTTPLIRRDGQLQEATWDEALDYVAEKLKQIEPHEFGAFSSAKVANEDNYLMQKFTRAVIGTNSVDHCARL